MKLLSIHRTNALCELVRISETSNAMKCTLQKTWIDPQEDIYLELISLGEELGFDLRAPEIIKSKIKIGIGEPPESLFDRY